MVAAFFRRAFGLTCLGVVLGAALSGCSSHLEPCAGAAIGARYEIEVVAVEPQADGTAPANCAKDWGIGSDAPLTARIVDTDGRDSCESGVAELSGTGTWEWQVQDNGSNGGGRLLEGFYAIRGNGCVADASVGLDCADCSGAAGVPCPCRLHVAINAHAVCPADCMIALTTTATRQ